VFRSARSHDIDTIHELLVAEAAQGRFDPRLAQEPYRSGLRKNLNTIRKRERRLDEAVSAQLLIWEQEGDVAGCLINSAILPQAGNEIWMVAVLPEFRGHGIGGKLVNEVLARLHPRVDLFVRCSPQAQLSCEMFLRRGFLPLDTTDKGMRVLKLPKMGTGLVGQAELHQQLASFVKIQIK
jgi:N-acetylglutamate synthase-like GNAT family acetyltransferase